MALIALTGATGFLGTHLTKLLNTHGHRVVSIGRKGCDVEVDLSQQKTDWQIKYLQDVEVLIHAAAVVGSDTHAFNANVAMANNLLSKIGPSKPAFIFISSASVYTHQSSIINEQSRPNPRDLYGKAKLVIEKHFELISNIRKSPLIILRPCSVYGEGESHKKAITIFCELVSRGIVPSLSSNSGMKRDYIHVTDAARGILLAVSRVLSGFSGIYNLCSGCAWSPSEVASMLCNLAGLPTPHQSFESSTIYQFDPSHARNELGFQTEVSLEKGLERLLRAHHSRTTK